MFSYSPETDRIHDPVHTRASAKHVTRLACDLLSEVVMSTERPASDFYVNTSLHSINAIRRELDDLERGLKGLPERSAPAPRRVA